MAIYEDLSLIWCTGVMAELRWKLCFFILRALLLH
jgi:hypothetical protein